MSQFLEERLAAAMRAAAPDLRPDPRLGRLAVEQARRTRHWRWLAAPIATAVAGIAIFALAVVVLHGDDDDPFPVDPTTGQLLHAPDWAGCRDSTLEDPGVLGPLPADPVAIAVCGPQDPLVAQRVWVAGASEAGAILELLAGSPSGTWIDTCAYERCETTKFALLQADGSVVELGLAKAGPDHMIAGGGHSWIVDAAVANAILGLRHSSASYVYPRSPSDGYPGEPLMR